MPEMVEKKLSDPFKRGTNAVFYGSKEHKPCGVVFHTRDDLGREVSVDFEVFSCDDVGVRVAPDSMLSIPAVASGFTAKEIVETLKEAFEKCGCKVG